MDEYEQVPLRKLLLRIALRLVLIISLILFAALLLPRLLDLLLPFILAFIAATLLSPVVRKFTKKVGKIRRFWSVLLILVLILAATGLLAYFAYYVATQIADLLSNLGNIQESATDLLNTISEYLEQYVPLTTMDAEEYVLELLQKALSWLTGKISSWAPNVVIGVGNLASGIASFFVSLLFFIIAAYFMTADYPNLRDKLSKWTPEIIRPHMRHIKDAMGSATFGYLKAQLILSGVVMMITFICLLIMRQDYALFIAILCGVIDFIPFFGSGLVLVPWGVIELIVGHFGKAVFLLLLSFGLFLFRKLAEPKVVGNQTGLTPLLSLISMYVGMRAGGVAGMILAPILCMIFISLYGVGFFDPTIRDLKMLFHRAIDAARLPEQPPKE